LIVNLKLDRERFTHVHFQSARRTLHLIDCNFITRVHFVIGPIYQLTYPVH